MDLSRLKQEQLTAISDTDRQIKQWEKFDDDYKHLQGRLKDLPNKVSYDVMVPLGPLAFIPGQLVHTNEILVLLGNNWFAEKSAKEAVEVVERRKLSIAKTIEDLKKQRYLLESRLDFTSDIQKDAEGADGIVDIREEYDAEKEAKWREERSRKRKEKTRKDKDLVTTAAESEAVVTRNEKEQELWSRLDELQRREEEMDELARFDEDGSYEEVSDGDDSSEGRITEDGVNGQPVVDNPTKRKSVKWKDGDLEDYERGINERVYENDEKNCDLEDVDREDEETDETDVTTILFDHTDSPKTSPRSDPKLISSPADIYHQYQMSLTKQPQSDKEPSKNVTQPKSILKHPSANITNEPIERPVPDVSVRQAISTSAFSGSIIEHKATEETTDSAQPKKRVSRFKQARQTKDQR